MVTVPNSRDDHSKGIAIDSLLQTDEHSHLEMVRYGDGSGFFRLLMVPHLLSKAPALVALLPAPVVHAHAPDPVLRAALVRN